MQTEVGKDVSQAVNLTNYFISLPKPRYQLVALLMLTAVLAAVLAYFKGFSAFQAMLTSFLLITVPAVLSAALFRVARGVMLKRALFLMLIASVLYVVVYAVFFALGDINALIIGYSVISLVVFLCSYFIFWLRYSGVMLSLTQLFFFSIMMYYFEAISLSPNDLLIKLAVSSAIFAAFTYILINIVNAPLKKAFSISSTKAFSLFVSQWLYGSRDLEAEFHKIGVYADTVVDALYVSTTNGSCLITSPQVHFGPFGSLGGSNFPTEISAKLASDVGCTVVMHGACTHDFNPTTSSQVERIVSPLRKFISEAKAKARPAKMAFVRTSHGKAIASHLLIGDSVLSTFSRHPHTTEDMDYGLGLLLREIGRRHFSTALIADEHNSETGEITQFLLGSEEAAEYVSAMRKLGSVAGQVKQSQAKFACAKLCDDSYSSHGISGNGISLFCFVSKGQSVLYVVIDSNGITNEAKSRLESHLRHLYTDVVIMTTDSHMQNKVSGVVNPFGAYDTSKVEEEIYARASALKGEVQPFKAYAKSLDVRLKVFGPRQSLKLIGTVNAIVSVAKFVLPLVLIAGILFALWALSVI
ncbi:MAG: DUF2070 family protein [Candidatus Micrarchaeota archaeon]|nr:DUF2070 family protein [Candidatus Micrarchaeota archaeon]